MKRKAVLYKDYFIKPVYKYQWCVFELIVGKNLLAKPGKRLSNHFISVDDCKWYIDNKLDDLKINENIIAESLDTYMQTLNCKV